MDDISGAGGDGEIEGVVVAAARKTYKLYVHTPQFCGEDLVIRYSFPIFGTKWPTSSQE